MMERDEFEYLGHTEHEQLSIPGVDPVIQFVVNGIKLSLQQNQMTREQAVEKIKSWYPDASIDLGEQK